MGINKRDTECFVSTHAPFAFGTLLPLAEETYFKDKTRNHNITDVGIEASSTQDTTLLVIFKIKCGKTIKRELTLRGFIPREIHFEIEDLQSVTLRNPSSTATIEIFVGAQKTFCICC